jgi:hypothetical protein
VISANVWERVFVVESEIAAGTGFTIDGPDGRISYQLVISFPMDT